MGRIGRILSYVFRRPGESPSAASPGRPTAGVQVLDALMGRDEPLAVQLVHGGCDLSVRDEHGNVPLHYAAAFGYTKVIEAIISRGVAPDVHNVQGQTPLVYAMEYDQPEAARLLWTHHRTKFARSPAAREQLLVELHDIGVDRSLPPDEASSGFFRKDSPLKHNVHPRVQEIGKALAAKGGISLMLKVHETVARNLGQKAASDLSSCWHGIGSWLH